MKNKIILLVLSILICSCSSEPSEKNEIETDWSSINKAAAVENCMQPGNPKGYCECLVSILETIFSYSEFVEFDALLRSGARPPEETISKMVEMGNRAQKECRLPDATK